MFYEPDFGLTEEAAFRVVDPDSLSFQNQETYRQTRIKELRRLLFNLKMANGPVIIPIRQIQYNNYTSSEKDKDISFRNLRELLNQMEDNGQIGREKGELFINTSTKWKKKCCFNFHSKKNKATQVWPKNLDLSAATEDDVEMVVWDSLAVRKDSSGNVSRLTGPEARKQQQIVSRVNASVLQARTSQSEVAPLPARRKRLSLSPSSSALCCANTSPERPQTVNQQIISNALDGDEIPKYATDYRRIFNRGSWECGGRFFNKLIQWNSDIRPHLRIDGNPVTEIDYDGFHFNMLYAIEGETLNGDPYETDCDLLCELQRPVNKKATNILFNSKNSQQLYATLKNYDWEEEIDEWPENIQMPNEAIKPIVHSIKDRHQPIKKYFHSDIGVHLQYEESEIAREVMTNTGAIGIHDGFIIEEHREDELRQEMKRAFRERFDSDISVSREFDGTN